MKAGWAALLSLAAPGLGQVYARRYRQGVAFWLASVLLALAATLLSWRMAPARGPFLALLGLAAATLALHAASAIAAFRQKRRQAAPDKVRWFMSTWFAALVLFALGMGATAAFAPGYGWRSFSVPSGSDIPTLLVGDMFLADARRPGRMPAPGEMVVFTHPRSGLDYVKRVVGVAGQRVQMRGGALWVDGREAARQELGPLALERGGAPLAATVYRETLPGGRAYRIARLPGRHLLDDTPEYLVPDGHFFVLGDYRDSSVDSRMMGEMGFVPAANLIGPAALIFWSGDWSRILMRVE